MHNPNIAVLGAVKSSFREVSNAKGTVAAGLLCHQKSDGTVTITKSDGAAVGISLGRDLSNTNRVSYCRKGAAVPIQLTAAFTPTIGAQVNISDTTGKAIASGGGATAYNAIYTKLLTDGAIDEDGNAVIAAEIDFIGGL